MRPFLFVLGCLTPTPCSAQLIGPVTLPPDTAVEKLQAVRVPVSITLRSMEESTVGIKLRAAGTFAVRNLESIGALDLGGLETRSFLLGVELLIPLEPYRTLRPYIDVGVGTDEATDETVFLIEAGILAEMIFRWRRIVFGITPAVRFNGQSGNELGATDDRVQGQFQIEARHPIPLAFINHTMYGGIYAETGYFFNSLDFLSVSGSAADVQSSFEVGISTGFFDVRPKIWFISFPRISVGYRFRGDLTGFRVGFGGDWTTKVFAPQ